MMTVAIPHYDPLPALGSPERKFRISYWLDLADERAAAEVFGIKARTRDGKWLDYAIDGVRLIFKTRATAEKMKLWLVDKIGTEPDWKSDLA